MGNDILDQAVPKITNPGHRNNGQWITTAGLTFSDMFDSNSIVSGFIGGITYTVQWRHNPSGSIYSTDIIAVSAPSVTSFAANTPPNTTLCAADVPASPRLDINLANGTAGYTVRIETTDVPTSGTTTRDVAMGTSNTVTMNAITASTDYRIIYVSDANGCIAAGLPVGPVSYTVFNPTIFTVNGGSGCAGTNTAISLSSSEVGVNYVLRRDGADVQTLAGVGGVLNFTAQTLAGTYEVFATDGTCEVQMTGSVTIVTSPTVYNVSVVEPAPYCSGNNYTIQLSGSDNGVTYKLYRGATLVNSQVGTGGVISFTNNSIAGTYSVEADNGVCVPVVMTPVTSMTINSPPTPFNVTGGVVCDGNTVTIGLSGFEAGIKYDLYRNPGNVLVATLIGNGNFGGQTIIGTYTILAINTVTGCTTNMNGSATVNPLPVNQAFLNTGLVCPNGVVALTNSVTGTTYQLWRDGINTGLTENGSTGNAITFGNQTTAGEYSVVAVLNGCSITLTDRLTIEPQPTVFNLSANSTTYCASAAVSGINLTLSGSEVGVDYQLMESGVPLGAVVIGIGAPLQWFNVTAGSYTVQASNIGGCSLQMNFNPVIVAAPAPTATISVNGSDRRCENILGNFTIQVTLTGTPPFNFTIEDDKGSPPIVVNNHNLLIYSFTVNPLATTTFVVRNLVDAASCLPQTPAGSATVYIDPIPVITFNPAAPEVCAGNAVIVTAFGAGVGGAYNWSDGLGNNQAINVAPAATHSYTVTATTALGCSDNNTVTVTVNPLPIVDFSTPGNIYEYCENDANVTLTGNPVGGSFSGTGILPASDIFSPAGAIIGNNNITYTYSDPKGCVNNITKQIVVNSVPNVFIFGLGTEYCANDGIVTFSGSPTAATGVFSVIGQGAGQNVWWGDNGNGTGWFDPTIATAQVGWGTYTFRYTYTDPNICTAYDEIDVTLHPDLNATVSFTGMPASACQNENTNYTLQGQVSGVDVASGVFTGPNPGLIDGGNDGTAVFNPFLAGNGTHSITFTYTDANGCTGSQTQTFTIGTDLSINLNPTYCYGDAAVTIDGTPNGGTVTLRDAANNLISSGPDNTVVFNPAVLAAGTYHVEYAFIDGGGCANSRIWDVEIYPMPDATFEYEKTGGGVEISQYCVSETSVTLTPIVVGGNFTGTAVSGNIFNPSIAGVGTHNITYTITQNGCTSVNTRNDMSVVPLPTIDINNLDPDYCDNEASFTVLASNFGTPGGVWTFTSTTNTVGVSPITDNGDGSAVFDPAVGVGSYTVTMTYVDPAQGCENSIDKVVTIYETPEVNFGGANDLLEFCQDDAPITLTASFNTSIPVGAGVFTGDGITDHTNGTATFDPNGLTVGDHPITYTYTNLNSCISTRIKTFRILDYPVSYSVTGGGDFCFANNPTGIPVGLSDSEVGVNYELLLNGISVAPVNIVAGTGSPISFGDQTAPGVYSVEAVNAASGCSVMMTGSATIKVNDVTLVVSTTDVSCTGGNDGSATVTASGGTANYVYEWRNSSNVVVANSAVASNLVADTYQVTVVDAVGCSTVTTGVVINEPNSALTVNVINKKDVGCDCTTGAGICEGSAEVSITGGTPNYTIVWSTGGAGTIENDIEPGAHSVTVTDNNGCIVTVPFTITQLPALTIVEDITKHVDNSCNGGNTGELGVTVGGGSLNYEYSIDNSTWFNTPLFTGLLAGSYDVWVRDANYIRCVLQIANAIVITEPAALTLTEVVASHIDVDCNNGATGQIEVVAGGGSGVFEYSNNAGANWQVLPIFTALVQGSYNVWVRDVADNSCVYSGLASIVITEPTPLSLSIASTTNVSCNGNADGAVVLSASGGSGNYVYSIDGGTNWVASNAFNGLIAGAYNFSVKDVSSVSCQLINIIGSTITEPDDFTITVAHTDISCFGGNDGTITVTPDQGGRQLEYSIDGGTNWHASTIFNNLIAGNYKISIRDIENAPVICTKIDEVSVDILEPAASVTIDNVVITDVTCNGDNDGAITITVSGGTGAYTYQWTNSLGVAVGGNSNNPTLLVADDYTVIVTDAQGCSTTATYTVTEPIAWDVQYTVTNVSTYGNSDGEIDIHTIVGNTPPYSVLWTDGSTDIHRTGLIAGTYGFTVTDSNGCTITKSNIVVSQPTELIATVTPSDVNCYGGNDGSIFVDISSGNPNYTISWTGNLVSGGTVNGSVTQPQNTYTIATLEAGTYTVDIVDASGNTKQSVVVVDQPVELTVTETVTGITCNGDNDGVISVVLSGEIAGSTISWTADNGFANGPLDATIPANLTRSNLASGNYTVTVTNNNGCSAVVVSPVAVVEPASWNVPSSVTPVSSYGNNDGVIDVINPPTGNNPPYSIEWTDLTTGGVPLPHPWLRNNLIAGDYTFTITDSNGCTYTETLTVTQPNQLLFDVSGNDATCYDSNNGSIALSITSGTPNYDITLTGTEYDGTVIAPVLINNHTTGNYTFSNLKAGTYSVKVIDSEGEFLEKAVTIDHLAEISVTLQSLTNVTCNSGSDGVISVSITGRAINEASSIINWTRDPAGWSLSGSVSGNKTQSGLSVGKYTINVTDENGCVATPLVDVVLTEPTAISATHTVTHVSTSGGTDGDITIDNIVSENGVKKIEWYNTSGIIAGETGQSLSNIGADTYHYVVFDNNDCEYTSPDIPVTEPSALVVSAVGNNINCYNANDGSIQVIITSGTAPYNVVLTGTPDDGSTFAPQSSVLTNTLFDNLKPGTYKVLVTDSATPNQTFDKDITITQNAETVLNPTIADIQCNGAQDGSITMNLTGYQDGSENWQVIDPNGVTIYNGALSGNATQTATIAGDYGVVVANQDGCTLTDTYTVTEPAAWNVNHVTTDVTPTGADNGTINIDVLSGNTPAYSIVWSDGHPDERLRTGLAAGTYWYTITDVTTVCTFNSGDIIISEPEALTVAVTPDDVDNKCYGQDNGRIKVDVTSGNEPYTIRLRGTLFDGTSFDETRTVNTHIGSELFDNLYAGTYQVDVTDNVSNTFSQTNVLIAHPAETTITETVTHLTCFAADKGVGTIVLTVNRAVGASDYIVWSGPSGIIKQGNLSDNSLLSLTVIRGGDYSYLFTDGNSCPITNVITITEPSPYIINLNTKDATIAGLNDGEINVHTITGNNGEPYTISWSDNIGVTSRIRSDLFAGTYEFTITDAIGCDTTISNIVVDEPNPLVVNVVPTDVTCYDGNNGSISVEFTSHNTGYYYQITGSLDDGATYDSGVINPASENSVVNNLKAGTYTINAYDVLGTHYFEDNIRIAQPAELIATTTVSDITCFGDANGSISVGLFGRPAGDIAAYRMVWNGPSGFYRDGTVAAEQVQNGLSEPGVYNITVFDGNNCPLTLSYTLAEPNELVVNVVNVKDITCNGGADGEIAITVSGRPAGNGYTYDWYSWNGAAWVSYAPNATPTMINLSAGIYHAEITSTSDGCTVISADITVTENDALSLNTTVKSITSCSGDNSGELTIDVTGGVGPFTLDYGNPSDIRTGSGPFVISNLVTGDYNVTVTDANLCSISDTYTITEPLPLVVNNVSYSIDCINDNTGVLNFDISGGSLDGSNNHQYFLRLSGPGGASYTRNITVANGATYSTPFTNLPAGSYLFEVQDKLSSTPLACGYVLNFDLELISITGTVTNATCLGVNTGTISGVTIDGSSGNYTYLWTTTDGQGLDNSTLDQAGLSAGTYNLTITDNTRGCTVDQDFVVINTNTLIITGAVKDVTCNGGSDGAVTNVNITDATPVVNYSWTGPNGFIAATDNITDISGGTYQLNVVDNNGCAATETFFVNEPAAITFDLALIIEDCDPYQRGINLNNLAGGIGDVNNYQFYWTGPGSASFNTRNLTGLTVGGTYTVTVKDENNCEVVKSITIPEEVVITENVTYLDCNGAINGAITIDITGGVGPFTYQWFKNNVPFANTKNIDNLEAATYKIVIIDAGESDGSQCTYNKDIVLSEPDAIVISGAVKHITCNGDADAEILLTVTGGVGNYSYSWSSGNGTGLIPAAKDQSGLSGGTYTVVVTDDNGCSATTDFTIIEPDAIEYDLTVTDTQCDGTAGAIQIVNVTGGSGSYTYTWAGPGITPVHQNTTNVTGLIAGDYTVTVWDAAPGHTTCYLTKTVTLTSAIDLTYSVVPETCDGQGDGAITINVQGGQPGYTYLWTTADGSGVVPDAQNQAGLTEGTYSVTVTDTRACSVTQDIFIARDNVINVIGAVTDVLCYGDNSGEISLTVSGGSGNFSYHWTGTGTGIVDGVKDQTGLSAGSYTVLVTDNILGCEVTQTYDVRSPAAPIVITNTLVTDILCKGEAVGIIDITVTGGTPFDPTGTPYYNYQWSGPDSFTDSPTQNNLIAGDYKVTVTDANGCFIVSNVITVSEPAEALTASVTDVVDVTVFGGNDGEIEIAVSGGTGAYSIIWSGTDLGGAPVGGLTNDINRQTGLVAGNYTVDITDGNGCTISLTDIFVNQPGGALLMVVTTQDIIPCQGNDNGQINVNVTGGVLPYTITWYDSGNNQLGQVTANGVTIDNLSAGVYRVDVTDANSVTISKNDITITEPATLQLSTLIVQHVDCYESKTGTIRVNANGGVPDGSGNYRIEVTGPNGYINVRTDITPATDFDYLTLASGVYNIRLTDDSNGDGVFDVNDDCVVERALKINQPEAKVTVSLDSEICIGESTQIKFVVENWADIATNNLSVTLSDGSVVVLDESPHLHSVTPVANTVYSITNVNDGAGCDKGFGEGTATVVVNPLPTARIYSDREICFGETATIFVDLTGAAPWTVTYTDGTTSTVVSGIAATPFSFDVTPNTTTSYTISEVQDNHCTNVGTGSVTITVNERADVTMTGNADICYGLSTDINLNFSAGTAPYNVTLTENGVSKTLTGLIPDATGNYIYTVTPADTTEYILQSVTDANGCDQTVAGSVLVTVRPYPEDPGAITGNDLVCQGAMGISYSIDEVKFATNYVWLLPAGATIVSGGGSDSITVDFDDAFAGGIIRVYAENGCAESARYEKLINVSLLPEPAGAVSGPTDLCQASTGVMYSVNTIANATGYLWTLPAGFNIVSGDGTSSIIVDLNPTIANLTGIIRVEGVNGCGNGLPSADFDVEVTPLPVSFAGNDEEICANTYTLQGNVVPGTQTGTWTILKGSGVIAVADVNNPSATVTNLSQGENIFEWKVEVDATGCFVLDTVVITNNQLTVIAAVEERVSCDGTAMVHGTPVPVGADGGIWTFTTGNGTIVDATNPSTQVVNLNPDQNILRWTITKHGCQSFAEVEIISDQPDQAVISNGDYMDVCSESVSLTANTPVEGTGLWTLVSGAGIIDNPVSSTINVTGLEKGDNVLRWTIEKNGCFTVDEITIRNNQLDVDAGGTHLICEGDYKLSATIPPAGVTGRWVVFEGAGTFDDGFIPDATVTGLALGTNRLIWEMDQKGCISTDTITLVNNEPTVAVVGAQLVVCANTVQLIGNAPVVGAGFWSVVSGSGKFDNVNDPGTVARDIQEGINTYRWTITNNGCSSFADQEVENMKVYVNADKDTSICERTTVLNGNIPTTGTGEWNIVPGMGSATFYPNTTVPNPRVGGLDYGNNVFVWTVNNSGCVSRDTVVISNNSPYAANAGTDQIINSTMTHLNATPALIGTGSWSLVSGGANIVDAFNAYTEINGVRRGPNLFRWTVEHLGCTSIDEVIITNGEVIEANAGLNQTICDSWTFLEANDPDVGVGEWSVVSGAGKLESPHNQKTRVYDLGSGQNVFRWTIYYTNSSSTDTVVITNNEVTVANAGPNRDLCGDTFTLEANIPAIGNAGWTVISGSGTFADPTDPNTVVSGLTQGANVLKYEISQLGCSSIDSVTIYNNLPTIADAGLNQTICTDSVELHANTPTFGVGEWRVEEGSAQFDGNWAKELAPGGNMLVWVISSANCVSTDTVHIQNDQPSIAFAGHDRVVCVDSVNLSANIPQYGVGHWEFISGSGNIEDYADPYSKVTGLARGANRFRWTVDNNGCTSSDDVEISNNLISAIAGANQINCADTATLEANLSAPGVGTWGVVGGSGSAIFEDTSNPYTVVRELDHGDNELTWTINYMGCTSVSKVVIRNDNPTKAFAGENIGLCVNTTELSANTPVIGDGVWTLVNGGGEFVDDENPQTRINNLKFGDNLLRWTITHNTCMSYDDVEVSFNRIDAVAGSDLITCSTDTILVANSALPGIGTWSVVGGGTNQAMFEDQNDPHSRVSNLAKGDNLLRWTVSYRGCETFDEVNIINNSPSTSYAGNSQELCEDNTILDATSVIVGQGHWEILTGAASISDLNDPKSPVSDLSKGDNVFRWTVLHKGCVSSDDVLITNNRPSEPYAGHNMDICYSNTTLKANPPEFGTGMWSIVQGAGNFSNPTDPNAQVENLAPDENILRWTLVKGQCTLYDEIIVTNNSPTIANAGPDIQDCKDWSELDANVPVHGVGIWTVVSGKGDFDNVNDPKTTVHNLGFGENILMWTVSKSDCFSSDQVVIFNQVPDPSDAGSNRTICEDYVVLNANNPVSGTGTWSVISGIGDFEDLHLFNTKVVNVGFGENVYKWTIAYAGSGCFTESTVTVTSNMAVPFAGDDATVYEPEYQMQAANPGTLQGTWSVVAGNGDFDDTGFFSTVVRNLAAGKNTFRWSIDVDGCGAYDDVTIWYKEVPDAGFEVDNENGCYPLDVKFTNYSVGGNVFYWDFGDGSTSTERHPVHTYTSDGEYTTILTIPGPDGQDAVYSKMITVYDHPVADFDVKPTTVYVPGDFIRLYDLSVDADSYLWDFGDGTTSDVSNPSHEYEDKGIYSIQLTVYNEFGCEDVMLKEDIVEAKMKGFVSFPNSFMPRPAGAVVSDVNAIFKPVYRDVDTYILQIFNRWGQLIFESHDINEGWDGIYKGKLAIQAVYVWKASGTYVSGKEFRQTGSVLLVR